MLNTPPTYIVTVPESGCTVARLQAYSLIWLLDRRCSGPGCSSTAHLGKPYQFWAVLIQNPPPPRLGRKTRCGPKNRPPPSRQQPTRTASEQPPADRPAAASRPTAAQSTQTADLVETHEAGLYQYSPPPAMQKDQCPPSQSQPTGTASEGPPADRPAAGNRPTDVKTNQTAVLMDPGDGLYKYSFPP